MSEATAQAKTKTFSERADELEHEQIAALDPIPQPSAIYLSGEPDPTKPMPPPAQKPGQYLLTGHDKVLSKMPDKPNLMDFFKQRFFPATHVLQSARL